MKKKIARMIIAAMMSISVTGCGFSDGAKDGMEAATEKQYTEDKAHNSTNTQKTTNTGEKTAIDNSVNDANESNPLIAAELQVADVNSGSGKKIGEYAYINVDLETMDTVTMDQYDQFCNEVVKDSGYNWITIDFGDGSGLCFQGGNQTAATYGTLDGEKCITEQKGNVMKTGDGIYEYTAF